jgi:hypothetical protein
MRTAILLVFLVSAAFVVPALGQSGGIYAVSFTDKVDRDEDGYYSEFSLEINADTQCYGCYDEETIGGNPEMEPYFRVVINDVDVLNTDVVFRDGNYRGTIRLPSESLEQFERQTLSVTVVLFDSDPVMDDTVDSWDGTIRYEPSWEDQPTPTPQTETPKSTSNSEVNASIVDFDPPSGTYQTGEIAFANVTVANEGTKSHTFFVGFGVIGPNGTIYDNDGTTGTSVTIEPNQTRTVRVAWLVGSDAPSGVYDAGTAVWKESDPSNLETRLDDTIRNSTFAVTTPTTSAQNTNAEVIRGCLPSPTR